MEAKTTHTPGPWFIDPYQRGAFYIGGKGVDILAEVPLIDSDDTPLPAAANAALIAAAPELYEALKAMVDAPTIPSAEMYEAARAALAKAKVQSE